MTDQQKLFLVYRISCRNHLNERIPLRSMCFKHESLTVCGDKTWIIINYDMRLRAFTGYLFKSLQQLLWYTLKSSRWRNCSVSLEMKANTLGEGKLDH